MKLEDTAPLMSSDDYKQRFQAEYYQTKIRYEKLDELIRSYYAGTLEFVPKCPLHVLESQAEAMDDYLDALEERADIEGIKIH